MKDPATAPWLEDLTGVVLAGGRGSRFGADKLSVELDGRPLVHHAIEAVAVVARHLIVVAAPDGEPPLPMELAGRIRVIHDSEPFGGPLVGLRAALDVVDTAAVIVVAGDMPRMVPAVLHRLAAAVGSDRPAVILEIPGAPPDRMQPLPMALDVGAARPVVAAILGRGGRSLRDLLRELGASSIPAPAWLALDPGAATIVDVDRPADLRS